MEENILETSHREEDLSEEIALLTEEIMKELPTYVALATHRCIVLHWFDLPIIEALLEDQELSIDEMSDVYQQLSILPFIDTLHFGLTFHYTTRQRLLHYYNSIEQQELLRMAARLAAPVYGAHEDDNRSMIEAFFCSIVAGDREYSIYLQNMLLEQGKFHDWYYFKKLFHVQDEAEALPFVQPLPRTEQQLLLRGLLYRMEGKQDTALVAYNQALTLNPKSAIAYINRGITYAEQENFEEALKDYNTALQIDKNAAQAYANRGVIYTEQAHYKKALKAIKKAIKIGLSNSFVFCSQGEALCQLKKYEEALDSYSTAILLDAEDVEAYIGQGQSHNYLKHYEQALVSFKKALDFDPDSAKAYRGIGYALNGQERYEEALVAYEEALSLDGNSAEAHGGKSKALTGLKRHKEALIASAQAKVLDPQYNIIVENATFPVYRRAINLMTLEKPGVTGDRQDLTISSRLPIWPDEAEMVRWVSQGDKDALITLYENYVDRVYRYFYAKVRNVAEAQDLTSETFTRAIEALMRGQYVWQGKPFGAWLFAIANNVLQERNRRLSNLPHIESVDSLFASVELASQGDDVSDSLGQEEEQAVLWDLVKKLPVAEQQVLIMRHVYCLPYNEIARRLKRGEHASQQLHYRALTKLRRLMQDT